MLFDLDQLPKQAKQAHHVAGEPVAGGARFMVGHRGVDLNEAIGELQPDQHVHLVSHGAWSFHELIGYALRYTGPARLLFTTWNITEDALRHVANWKASGQLQDLVAILDSRIPKNNAEGYAFALRLAPKLHLMHIHAKGAVLINDERAVHITSTANLTRNRRTEAFVVCTHRSVVQMHEAWMTSCIDGGN